MLGVMSSNAVYVIIYVVYKFVLPWSGSGISIMSLLPMFSQHMTGYSFFDTISQCECGCVYVAANYVLTTYDRLQFLWYYLSVRVWMCICEWVYVSECKICEFT